MGHHLPGILLQKDCPWSNRVWMGEHLLYSQSRRLKMDLDKEISYLRGRLDALEQDNNQRKSRTCPRCGSSLRPSPRYDMTFCQGNNGLCGRLWTSGRGQKAYFSRSTYEESTLASRSTRVDYETDVSFCFIAGRQVSEEEYENYGGGSEND